MRRRPVPRVLLLSLFASSCQLVAGITDRSEGNGVAVQRVCNLDSECEGGDVCLFEKCSSPCEVDKQCTVGFRCLHGADRPACVSNAQAACVSSCPTGTGCASDLTCRSLCQDSAGCSKDQLCSSDGFCYGTDSSRDPTTPVDGGIGAGGQAGSGGAGGFGAGGADTGGGFNAGGITGDGGAGTGGLVGDGGSGAGGLVGTGGSGTGGVATGGTAGSGGTIGTGGAGTGGVGTGGAVVQPDPPAGLFPTVQDTCPTFANGQLVFRSTKVQIWAGPSGKTGPLLFYWHGTGGSAQDVNSQLGPAIADVTANGGVVASFITTTGVGVNTGSNVWYTGDFTTADEVVACAVAANLVDKRQIYVAGYSAGGLQAGTMSLLRSNYVAAVGIYSGGAIVTNPVADSSAADAFVAHGAQGSDLVIVDFHDLSITYENLVKGRGAFVIDCDDGGSHVDSKRFSVASQMWKFLKAHPFGQTPEPYAAGIPGSLGLPSYCH